MCVHMFLGEHPGYGVASLALGKESPKGSSAGTRREGGRGMRTGWASFGGRNGRLVWFNRVCLRSTPTIEAPLLEYVYQ